MPKEENQTESVQTSPIGEKIDIGVKSPEVTEEATEEVSQKMPVEINDRVSWNEIETKSSQNYQNKPKSELRGEVQETPGKPLLSGKAYANLGILLAFLCFLPKPDLVPFLLGPLGVICGMVAYVKNEQARAILAVTLSVAFSIISIFFLEAILTVF